MFQNTNLVGKPDETVLAKLSEEIARLEQVQNDPTLTSPLAPYRDQIIKLRDDLKQPYKQIAAVLTAAGMKTTAYTVGNFYEHARKKRNAANGAPNARSNGSPGSMPETKHSAKATASKTLS